MEEKEFKLNLYRKLVAMWNETPYMEDPTRTELADKINDMIKESVKKIKNQLCLVNENNGCNDCVMCNTINEEFGGRLIKND